MLSGVRPTKRKNGRGQQSAACASTPRFAHIVLAAVLGALTAKQAARLREAPPSDATQHCGEVRHQEQFGNKEQQVGLSARLQSGNLKNILDKVEDGVVVLTFADSKYKESMINWLINVERQGITNYAVVCLDHDLPPWLAERKGRCDYVMTGWKEGAWSNGGSNTCAGSDQKPTADGSLGLCKMSCEQDTSCQAISWNKLHKLCYLCSAPKYEPSVMHQVYIKKTKDTLWFTRWKLLLRLLNRNVHVLMADLDATFVQNPLPLLKEYGKEADIISQRGSFPEHLFTKWGATVCMGFTFWRATTETKIFTAMMNKVIAGSGDDQVAVNQALEHSAIAWSTTSSDGKMEYHTAKEPTIGLTHKGLRSMLLPHNLFPRKCDEIGEAEIVGQAVVAHCFAEKKTGAAKIDSAKKYGLWSVRDDWGSVDPATANSFREYLRLIRVDGLSDDKF
eukprot:Rhum_TRINITY_DN18730_c0_g1::Rhum_TRINITY_DN18730_c0_g1_i1::g.168139::m.168139